MSLHVQPTTSYEDGQLCIRAQLETRASVRLKYIDFKLDLPPGVKWPARLESSRVDASWNASAESYVIQPDTGMGSNVWLRHYFDDDTSDGVLVDPGTHEFTIKLPLELGDAAGQIAVTPLHIKGDDGLTDPEEFFDRTGVPSSEQYGQTVAIPASQRTKTMSETPVPTPRLIAPGVLPAWTPSDTQYVPVVRIEATGVASTGGDISCDALEMWNASEHRADMGVCRIELVEGSAGQETFTELQTDVANFKLKQFTFDGPVLLTASPTTFQVSCRAESNFTGTLAVGVGLACDSDNYHPFVQADTGNTPVALPSITGGQITGMSRQVPLTNEFVPATDESFVTTDSIMVDFEATSDPGQLRWRVLVDDLQVDEGNGYCEPGGAGYACNFVIDPLVDGHGYLLDLAGRTATLVVGVGVPMESEYLRKTLDLTRVGEFPDGE